MAEVSDQPVANPTYLGNIRAFFNQVDIDHMAQIGGIDLGTYTGVRHHALEIYFQTAPPHQRMPPDPLPKWSAAQCETFENWIGNGYPLGTAQPADSRRDLAGAAGQRIRKNVISLDDGEIQALADAFTGLMQRDPSDPNSYYALAGLHGLPNAWCAHHDDPFNPWHRTYLKLFEDQLQTISPGVTLPYWDITTQLPDVLQQGIFASYELPQDPGAAADPADPGTYFPYTTQRYSPDKIQQNMQTYGVYDDISRSLRQSVWGASGVNGYQQWSIMAHDGGHNSIGPTMADQNVAAFDPIFWFFHCNLDRLWWSWQTIYGATTLNGFRSLIVAPENPNWLSPPINQLTPFEGTSDQSIDLGIGYDVLAEADKEAPVENTVGSVEAARTFTVKPTISVRVKDIDRLSIPGPFVVSLLADGEAIAKRAFFQPRKPRNCSTCRKNALVNIDFRVEHETLLGRKLSIEIEVPHQQEEIGRGFPLTQAGNPTINARLLLEDE